MVIKEKVGVGRCWSRLNEKAVDDGQFVCTVSEIWRASSEGARVCGGSEEKQVRTFPFFRGKGSVESSVVKR